MAKEIQLRPEWRCCSRMFQTHYIVTSLILGTGALVILAMILLINIPREVRTATHFMFGLLFFMTILSLWYAKKQKYLFYYKQVVFTPEVVYVNGHKIGLHMVNNVRFISPYHITTRNQLTHDPELFIGYVFMIEFITSTPVGTEAVFLMDFNKSLSKPFFYLYDYQKNFMDVVMQHVHEAKKRYADGSLI